MREAINPFHLKLLLSCSLQIFWAEMLRISVSITKGRQRKVNSAAGSSPGRLLKSNNGRRDSEAQRYQRTRNGCFVNDFRPSLIGFPLCLCVTSLLVLVFLAKFWFLSKITPSPAFESTEIGMWQCLFFVPSALIALIAARMLDCLQLRASTGDRCSVGPLVQST
jgi:hypothetical protein